MDGSVACDWYAPISEPPPELPTITTVSTPASSRSHRTPGADVDERVLEQEERLVAPVPGVPAEEPDAALGQRLGEVVLGEVDVVVGRDARHLRRDARRPVVEPLARDAVRARRGCWSRT